MPVLILYELEFRVTEMAQQLRAFAALAENLASVPNTYVVTHV